MNTQHAIDLLTSFVNQRPGLNYADYGNPTTYRQESREITKDKQQFNELLTLALRLINADELNEKIAHELVNSSGRLTLKGDRLQYITGQYFPTEYRPAACRVLVNVIWKDCATRIQTGDKIRSYLKRYLSRSTYQNYIGN